MSVLGGTLPAGSDAQQSDGLAPTAAPTIVEEARSGSAEAWEVVYRRLGPALTRYAASRGVPDPEDVTQDVMWAAASRIEEFTGGWDDLRSWLFTIAYRRCADHHRRRYRRPEQLIDQVPDWADPAGAADEPVWANGAAEEALAALEILNQRERDVVSLRIIGELPTIDVASATGLSVGNVRVIQSRALGKLRSHLENNGGTFDKRFRLLPVPLMTAAWRRFRALWGDGNEELTGRLGEALAGTESTAPMAASSSAMASAPSIAAAVPAVVSASAVGAGSLAVGSAVLAVAMTATVATAAISTPQRHESAAPAATVQTVVVPGSPERETPALLAEPRPDPTTPDPSLAASPDPVPPPAPDVSTPSDEPPQLAPPANAATEEEADRSASTAPALPSLFPLVDGGLAALSDMLGRLGVGDLSGAMATLDLVTGTVAEAAKGVERAVDDAVSRVVSTVDAASEATSGVVDQVTAATTESVASTVEDVTGSVAPDETADAVEDSAAGAAEMVEDVVADTAASVEDTVAGTKEAVADTAEVVEETLEDATEVVDGIIDGLLP